MSGHDELKRWWAQISESEANDVVPKAVEYGSEELRELGRHMRLMLDPSGQEGNTEQQLEAAIYWYVIGKVARWTAAVRRGDPVSDDTLKDIATYVKMAQRVRAVGDWPVAETPIYGPYYYENLKAIKDEMERDEL